MPTALHLIVVVAGLLLTLATLPLLLELLGLSLAAALPAPAPAVSGTLRLAVIVPAHNEEQLIATCIRSLLGPTNVTVYVVAHNCSDATATRAAAAGATVLELNDTVGGKGTALDHGFQHAIRAGAEALLVVDADSVAGPTLTAAVAATIAAGAGAVQARYQVANAAATSRTRLAALAFLGMNVVRPRGRERLGLSCGIFGNGFALSADTLARVPYTANSLVEDLEYHLHLIRAGIRVRFLDHVAVFGEMPDSSAAASTQRARWEGGRILMRRQWTRPLALEVLRGRLYLLEPLLDLRALPLATEAVLLVAIAVLGLCTHIAWLTGYSALGLGTLVLYILVAAALGPAPATSLKALAAAPAYLLWKVLLIPKTRLASRRDADWVRTKRNADPPQ